MPHVIGVCVCVRGCVRAVIGFGWSGGDGRTDGFAGRSKECVIGSNKPYTLCLRARATSPSSYSTTIHTIHSIPQLGPAAAGRGMFCYHCPPALHPAGPHPSPRLPALDYPFAPTHPCKYTHTRTPVAAVCEHAANAIKMI